MEKYSGYEFEIKKVIVNTEPASLGFIYQIYDPDYVPSEQTIIRASSEWFEFEGEARFAAIGHIGLLENGEG